jgi:2'-5' RNA ligase
MTDASRRGPDVHADRRRRLFFALWPDVATRARIAGELDGWIGLSKGRPQRPDQWHVTLVFIGGVDANRVKDVERAGASVRGRMSELCFDRLEYWHKPRVACLTASATPEPLLALVQGLETALAERDVEFDRRDYHPHLTLVRKVMRFELPDAMPVLTWPIREFVLVESLTGRDSSRYEPFAHYALDV